MKEEIKNFIKKHNMTQRQFADVVDYKEETVSRWLSGKQIMGDKTKEYVKFKMDYYLTLKQR